MRRERNHILCRTAEIVTVAAFITCMIALRIQNSSDSIPDNIAGTNGSTDKLRLGIALDEARSFYGEHSLTLVSVTFTMSFYKFVAPNQPEVETGLYFARTDTGQFVLVKIFEIEQ